MPYLAYYLIPEEGSLDANSGLGRLRRTILCFEADRGAVHAWLLQLVWLSQRGLTP
jgi:hypothetical protein